MVKGPSQETPPSVSGLRYWVPLLAFLFLAFAIGAAGYFAFSRAQQNVKDEAHATLGTIADLRINQVVKWRETYRSIGAVMAGDPLLAVEIERWLTARRAAG